MQNFQTLTQKKETTMNSKLNQFVLSVSKINRQHIQLFFLILTLAMLVLGVGAPDDGGGVAK
jgi:hypothetical protein